MKLKLIERYYHLPILEASNKLGVSSTVLKNNCRTKGIKRWPFRKINSVNKIIFFLNNELKKTTNQFEYDKILNKIKKYEEKLLIVKNNPNIKLTGRLIAKNKMQYFSNKKINMKKFEKYVSDNNKKKEEEEHEEDEINEIAKILKKLKTIRTLDTHNLSKTQNPKLDRKIVKKYHTRSYTRNKNNT